MVRGTPAEGARLPHCERSVAGGKRRAGDGVYAGELIVDGERHPAAISVGTNPTFDGTVRRVEAYVLDRDDLALYGKDVAVDFVVRLRGMVRFDNVDELIAQMADDVERARAALALHRPS